MTTYTITDTTTGTTATIETDAIAATVIGWCPDAPADVVAAATSLEQAIRNGDPADEFAVFLAVTVDRTVEQTADILDQLNTYEADNEFTADSNIWADVIDHLDPIEDGYGADASGMDRFELADGRRFRWDRSRDIGYRWGEA